MKGLIIDCFAGGGGASTGIEMAHILKDIFLRMLKAEPELKVMQGFPPNYIIARDAEGKKYPIKEQIARIGNNVVPIMAEKLVAANCGDLREGV